MTLNELTRCVIVVLDATVELGELTGSVSSLLPGNVRHLAPEEAAFDAMLRGWGLQQRARSLKAVTIRLRSDIVRRFAGFTDQYPWQWTPAEVEEFIAGQGTTAGTPVAPSTARGYQNALRLFMEYLTDARYGWPEHCERLFGQVPAQILHEWNSTPHVTDYEGDPRRRALSYDEIQALFDAAEVLVEQVRSLGRKGERAAHRDAILLKTVYAFGLRRREAWGLDVADLRRNPRVPQFGPIGAVFVRWAKSSRGSQPKRRTVFLVPEMDWLVPIMHEWLEVLRPNLGDPTVQGLWTTERGGRLAQRGVNEAFVAARDAAGLPHELSMHCLRHSYVSHLAEFGYPEKFIQDQVGHTTAATTAIYTHVSDEFRNRLLLSSMQRQAERWEMPL